MADIKIFTDDVGPNALNQIYTLAAQAPFASQKIRIMPDVHRGIGCVIGFTSTMGTSVIPNVIGVDIGCGMYVAELGKRSVDLSALDSFIKKNIPSGKSVRKEVNGEEHIDSLFCRKKLANMPRLLGSIGTLGGGNHFIEIDKDDEDNLYLIIHSGSRNLGMQVASIYQKQAQEECKNAAQAEREKVIEQLNLEGTPALIPDALKKVNEEYAYKTKIPADLCYLDSYSTQTYMHDMRICQVFAVENRKRIATDILNFLHVDRCSHFETIHNYISDDGIIRKGAISAKKGERVLIPMNMRDGCILAVGKGNTDWNCSAPHGAGRLLSRADAKKMLSVEEFKAEMSGIYTTTADNSTLDEAPMAYKPAEEIQILIEPTVDIEKIIKPIYNFKAAE